MTLTLLALACNGAPDPDGPDDTDLAVDDTASSDDTGSADDTGATDDTGTPSGDPERDDAIDRFDALASEFDAPDLSSAEAAKAWAGLSAPNLLLYAVAPQLEWEFLKSAWTEAGNEGVPDCPVVVEENDTVEITGGCTDFQGGIWHGRFGPSDSGTFRYELDNFGVERSNEACAGQTTDYVQNGILGLNGADFEFIMVSESSELADDCSPLENRVGLNVLLAQEDITEDDGTTTTVYNSSGRVAVSDATKEGVADIRTDDERTNGDWCGTEAWSGSTTVEGQQTLVITYDGETDCDPESTVTWSVDGADQGELTGVSCATTPATGLAGLLVGLLAALRRRR